MVRGRLYPFSFASVAVKLDMTNAIAFWLGLIILGVFALDHFVLHLDLARLDLRQVEHLAGSGNRAFAANNPEIIEMSEVQILHIGPLLRIEQFPAIFCDR